MIPKKALPTADKGFIQHRQSPSPITKWFRGKQPSGNIDMKITVKGRSSKDPRKHSTMRCKKIKVFFFIVKKNIPVRSE